MSVKDTKIISYFPDLSSEFVFIRTYSRWNESLKRRETWDETVDRYINFIKEERGNKIPEKVLKKMKQYIVNMEVMPSMRALWAAGTAAKVDNTCMYNCSFQSIKTVRAFAECLYILMCGTGYGFSVQKINIDSESLPVVPTLTSQGAGIYKISDDKAGWADSIKLLLNSLYSGKDIDFDYSVIRKKGDKLKTMGGRASGSEPLIKLHNFIRDTFAKAQGRKLTTLECHDVCNEVAEIVVVGGVRRSSEISLSDLNDVEMRNAKNFPFPPRRYMANNSAVYETKPNAVDFLKEWSSLASSGSGERGIFNLGAAKLNAPSRRDSTKILGTNPCGEILLRNEQFCNLSEVVIRANDDLDDLLEKVECATWIGTIQSTFTYFPYLNENWKKNCEEERLLGVSLTGQMDNPSLMTESTFKALKNRAIKIAKKASAILEINMPAAITCVKPSGTVSQLVNSASGLHVRYSPFYIRRYRISATDSLFQLLKDQKVPMFPENGQEHLETKDVTTWVLSFAVKSPESAVTRHNVSALEQLEYYKKIQKNWCEHNASCTIYVKDNEWFLVGNWVYENWDYVGGLSFLPYDGGIYKQAPYEEITENEYNQLKSLEIKIDYSQLINYEQEDNTESQGNYACTGDKCELK